TAANTYTPDRTSNPTIRVLFSTPSLDQWKGRCRPSMTFAASARSSSIPSSATATTAEMTYKRPRGVAGVLSSTRPNISCPPRAGVQPGYDDLLGDESHRQVLDAVEEVA